jgi:hypothetical protein
VEILDDLMRQYVVGLGYPRFPLTNSGKLFLVMVYFLVVAHVLGAGDNPLYIRQSLEHWQFIID